MSEPRNIRWDIAALLLAAFALFVWTSLLTYDAADPLSPTPLLLKAIYSPYEPDQISYPPNDHVTNRCGYIGAFVAQAMMHAFGAGSFIVGSLLTLTVVVLLRQKPLASPLGRSLGWTIVLVTLLSLMDLTRMNLPMALPLGPGGAIGAMGAYWINTQFAFAGGIIVCLCALVIGLMLSTEYAIFRGVSFLTIGLYVVGKRLGLPVAQVVRQTASLGTQGLARLHNSSVTIKQADVIGKTKTPRQSLQRRKIASHI